MEYRTVGDVISKAKIVKCGTYEYPVLSMTMHEGIVFQGDRFKKQIASVDQSTYNVVRRNQLVVSFPIDEGVLAIQDIADAGIVSPAYKIWDVDQSLIVPKFLEMFLRSPHSIQYYCSKLRGTTARRRSITDADLLGMELPLLSVSEQEKVVDIINRVNRIKRSYETALKKMDELIKARFVEMFGDENNSKNLPVIKIQDVADVQVGVVIKPAQYYTDEANGTKAFRSLNIGEMHIKDSDWVFFNDEGQKKNSKSILRANDLVIVRSGAPGTACVITKEYEGANAIDVIIAHPDMDKVNPLYLCAFTNYPHGKRQINEGTGGAAQQHFNVGKYKEMDLIYPPKHEQDEFVAFVKQVDKSKAAVQKSLDETQLLFDSLMQQYFG